MISDHLLGHVGQYALIRNSRHQLLLIQRLSTKRWCLPGGRLEEGEDVVGSLQREVKEESNLECSDPKPFAVHLMEEGELMKYCVYFSVTTNSIKGVKVDDDKIFKWVSLKKVKNLKFDTKDVKRVVLDFLSQGRIV